MENLYVEGEALEAARVLGIRSGRPYCEDALGPERGLAYAHADVAIDPLVLHLRQRPRSVVDVEQDDVERPG